MLFIENLIQKRNSSADTEIKCKIRGFSRSRNFLEFSYSSTLREDFQKQNQPLCFFKKTQQLPIRCNSLRNVKEYEYSGELSCSGEPRTLHVILICALRC